MVDPGTALLGANMAYVSAVLLIIAMWLKGKVGDTETLAMCAMTGTLNVISAFYFGFILGDWVSLAGALLFGFTYWYVVINIGFGAESFAGLGYYAGWVSIVAFIYVVFLGMMGAYVNAFFFALWGQLWFNFYLQNTGKIDRPNLTANNTLLVAVINMPVAIGFIYGMLTATGDISWGLLASVLLLL